MLVALNQLTALYRWPLLLQFSALQDITTTPAHTAAFAARRAHIKGILVRTTVSPALETPPPTMMVPLTSCSAKVCISVGGGIQFPILGFHFKYFEFLCHLQTDDVEESSGILQVTSNLPTTRGTILQILSALGSSTLPPNAGSLLLSLKSTCLLRMNVETTW